VIISRKIKREKHVALMGKYVHTRFLWENLRERDHSLGRPGVDGRIILKCMLKKQDGGVDWIDLAHYRDRWRAFVNTVVNLRVK
jgi:hypothetical protein